MNNIIEEILEACTDVEGKRNPHSTLAYLMEEVGELATEVNIRQGFSKKDPGEDGVIGEAADVILCAIDLIYQDNPFTTSYDIEEVIKSKLNKWKNEGNK